MEEIVKTCEAKMNKAIESLHASLATIRSGSVEPSVLDRITIDYYGEKTSIKTIASVSCPSATQMLIKPYDPTSLKAIVSALGQSDLGINPIVDGSQIRLNFPALTGDRRKEFVKRAKEYCDESKVAIRNIRRDANDSLKKANKNSEITEDELKTQQNKVQKETDKYIKIVDDAMEKKSQEILTV